MYAIIKTGGKQVKVEVGSEIYVEKLNAEVDSEITFNEVVFVGGEEAKFGTPYVEGASVVAKVLKQGKEKKVIIFKYKNKTNYRRTTGHRQPYTKLLITAINA